ILISGLLFHYNATLKSAFSYHTGLACGLLTPVLPPSSSSFQRDGLKRERQIGKSCENLIP
ncbi:hypothetical protein ACQP3J_31430, partial [Escherichia coli]